MRQSQKLQEIALLFLRLGVTAFGGPAAHISMMEHEVVTKRNWMTREHFLDLVGATNLIPGPNSTEMAIHCGYHYAGIPGLVVAGASFILPAALLTAAVAWIYVQFGSLPQVDPFLVGIRPAVLAIILSAVVRLGQKALKSWELGLAGAAVVLAALLGASEILAILAGGVIGMAWLQLRRRHLLQAGGLIPLLLYGNHVRSWLQAISAHAKAALASVEIPLHQLFLSLLKIGSVLFGSGYVLVAYLEDELVHRLGWLTQQELLDAIAAGQFTPGPVLTTSTFVALLNPQIAKLRRSSWASAFLDAVNVSAVGIMVAVVLQMGTNTLTNWKAWLIALASAAAVFGPRHVNTAWIVLGGAILGYLLYTL